MGSIVSRIRLAVRFLRALSAEYDELAAKLYRSPGLPVEHPSTAYWAVPPAPIATHGADDHRFFASDAAYADVVVIGSGITGTSVVRTLLDVDRDMRVSGKASGRPLRVVMLEARDACSGATARNGGHITPPLYHDYASLVQEHGRPTAQQIIRFRLAHLAEFLAVAEDEGLTSEAQAREVQTLDVFFHKEVFEGAKKKLAVYVEDMPAEGKRYAVLEGEGLAEEYQFAPEVAGCITTTAGAIHPYRFVTAILARLLRDYGDNFFLFTHTPCTNISAPTSASSYYTLTTPKGTIRSPHVVHATNGWAAHLLEPMRGKIVPLRATMSAQRPGTGLGLIPTEQRYPCPAAPSVAPTSARLPPNAISSKDGSTQNNQGQRDSWLGSRSFIFYPTDSDNVWDYLTQLPPAPSGHAEATLSPMPPPCSPPLSRGVSPEPFLLRSLESTPLTRLPRATTRSPIRSSNDSAGTSDNDTDTCLESCVSATASTARTDPDPDSQPSYETKLTSPPSQSSPNIYPPPAAEMMFGGGLGQSTQAFFDSAGNADDGSWFRGTGSHLSGALSVYFTGWGAEGRDEPSVGRSTDSSTWAEGRVKAIWSGILGASADGKPWVGRLSQKLSGRPVPSINKTIKPTAEDVPSHLASPGEWIAAGYTGEGMVHAWMSGKALAGMILGAYEATNTSSAPTQEPAEAFVKQGEGQQMQLALEDSARWFPTPFLASEARWRRAHVEDLLEEFLP